MLTLVREDHMVALDGLGWGSWLLHQTVSSADKVCLCANIRTIPGQEQLQRLLDQSYTESGRDLHNAKVYKLILANKWRP